jgi:hypothetical protein
MQKSNKLLFRYFGRITLQAQAKHALAPNSVVLQTNSRMNMNKHMHTMDGALSPKRPVRP